MEGTVTTAADAIVECLADANVRKIFGVVGTSTLDLVDAIVREPRLEFVGAREEEAAAHMADGYARATRSVGVVLAHVGPGALRQMYGVGTAWKDSVPLLVMTGNEMLRMTDVQAREAYHVVDIISMYGPITKAAFQLREGADARSLVSRALWLASSGRPGPVLLDLPKSSLKDHIETSQSNPATGGAIPASRPRPGAADLQAAASALGEAACPVVYAGGGVHWSAASAALVDLVERANLPVVTTDAARGSIPEDHRLALGAVARQAGDRAARELLAEADLIIALGSPFSDVSTLEWSAWSPGCRVIQVDIAPEAMHKGTAVDRAIVADAREFLTALDRELAERDFRCARAWDPRRLALDAERSGYLHDERKSDNGVNPWRVLATLAEHLPRDSFISIDSGMHSFFGKKLPVLSPGTYIRSAGFGAMGYSLPALLGAVEGAPDTRGMAIVGDGCLAMCLGEFETAARRQSPVTVVVLNDASFASQLHHQHRRFAGRVAGTRFGRTDFVKIAEAQGVPGWTATTDPEAERAIVAALAASGPNVVDVHVDPEIVPPTWIEGSGDARSARPSRARVDGSTDRTPTVVPGPAGVDSSRPDPDDA